MLVVAPPSAGTDVRAWLSDVVQGLREQGVLVADVAVEPRRYQGILRLGHPGSVHRRFDLRYAPRGRSWAVRARA